jgi:hypothetical protein
MSNPLPPDNMYFLVIFRLLSQGRALSEVDIEVDAARHRQTEVITEALTTRHAKRPSKKRFFSLWWQLITGWLLRRNS